MVEIVTQNLKIEGLNPDIGNGREEIEKVLNEISRFKNVKMEDFEEQLESRFLHLFIDVL